MFATCVKHSCGNRAYRRQEGSQDDCLVGCQWCLRGMVAPMWLLHFIMVHSFFMAATPSVFLYTPGIPAKHGIARKTVGEVSLVLISGRVTEANGSFSPGRSEAPPLVPLAGWCLHCRRGQQGRV